GLNPDLRPQHKLLLHRQLAGLLVVLPVVGRVVRDVENLLAKRDWDPNRGGATKKWAGALWNFARPEPDCLLPTAPRGAHQHRSRPRSMPSRILFFRLARDPQRGF